MLLGESEIRRRISLIADSSLASRAASDSWLTTDELTGRAASVPPGRFGAIALRRCGLVDPALERRRIAHPRLRTTPILTDYIRDLRPAKWGSMINLRCKKS